MSCQPKQVYPSFLLVKAWERKMEKADGELGVSAAGSTCLDFIFPVTALKKVNFCFVQPFETFMMLYP